MMSCKVIYILMPCAHILLFTPSLLISFIMSDYVDLLVILWSPEKQCVDVLRSHECTNEAFLNGVGTEQGIFEHAASGSFQIVDGSVLITCDGKKNVFRIKQPFPKATDEQPWAGNKVGATGSVVIDPSQLHGKYGASISGYTAQLLCCEDEYGDTCFVYGNRAAGILPTEKGQELLFMIGFGGSWAGMGYGTNSKVTAKECQKLCDENHQGHKTEDWDQCITNAKVAESPFILIAHVTNAKGSIDHCEFLGELPTAVSDDGDVCPNNKIHGPVGCPSHRVVFSPKDWSTSGGEVITTYAIKLDKKEIKFIEAFCEHLSHLNVKSPFHIERNGDTAHILFVGWDRNQH